VSYGSLPILAPNIASSSPNIRAFLWLAADLHFFKGQTRNGVLSLARVSCDFLARFVRLTGLRQCVLRIASGPDILLNSSTRAISRDVRPSVGQNTEANLMPARFSRYVGVGAVPGYQGRISDRKRVHLPELLGLRGVAIMIIVCGHLLQRVERFYGDAPLTPFEKSFFDVLATPHTGCLMLFCISGYTLLGQRFLDLTHVRRPF
jgi:hypothetical protein